MKAKELKEMLSHIDDDTNVDFSFTDDYPKQDDDMKDYYLYSDTDSIHCLKLPEEELKQFMRLDDYELGAYKVESTFERAKFIRQKCYIEIGYDGKVNSTIAGMPKRLGKYVNLDNFNEGFSIKADDETYDDKKLTYKHVKGGVILVPTDFTIKS